MTETNATAPLVRTATVTCTAQRAFDLFTREMAAWWPVSSHSVGKSPACTVDLEGFVGGHIVETLPDGTRSVWGTVTTWEPPNRVAFTWHPGRDPQEATEVHVAFEPAGGTGTTVTLTHSGWTVRPDGVAARRSYETGWGQVLAGFVAATLPSAERGA